MIDLLFKDESYKIIGSCFKVHSELGPVFQNQSIRKRFQYNSGKMIFLLNVKKY